MSADVTSLSVEFLFSMEITVGEFFPIGNGPKGNRTVAGVTGGTVTGRKVNGTVVGPGGDWVYIAPDGMLTLDVRAQIKTDDGAVILISYAGKANKGNIRTAPTFETGDERYAWLNGVQAVGVGKSSRGSVSYDVYQLL